MASNNDFGLDTKNAARRQRQIEHELREAGIDYSVRCNGHYHTKTKYGSLVHPIHGELPKGTLGSLTRMLSAILRAAACGGLGYVIYILSTKLMEAI